MKQSENNERKYRKNSCAKYQGNIVIYFGWMELIEISLFDEPACDKLFIWKKYLAISNSTVISPL